MDSAGDGAAQVSLPITPTAVSVNNGAFAVVLDFSSDVFDGSPRWLQIGVRTNNASVPFTSLLPRQAIRPTPYALHANNAVAMQEAGVTYALTAWRGKFQLWSTLGDTSFTEAYLTYDPVSHDLTSAGAIRAANGFHSGNVAGISTNIAALAPGPTTKIFAVCGRHSCGGRSNALTREYVGSLIGPRWMVMLKR